MTTSLPAQSHTSTHRTGCHSSERHSDRVAHLSRYALRRRQTHRRQRAQRTVDARTASARIHSSVTVSRSATAPQRATGHRSQPVAAAHRVAHVSWQIDGQLVSSWRAIARSAVLTGLCGAVCGMMLLVMIVAVVS